MNWKGVKGSDHGLIEGTILEGPRKTISARRVSATAEIPTEHLMNTSEKSHRLSQIAWLRGRILV
jgi:hypothetical protein